MQKGIGTKKRVCNSKFVMHPAAALEGGARQQYRE